MTKTILVTGATDGIGLATVKTLASQGHTLLLHGRSEEKLTNVKAELLDHYPKLHVETYLADLAKLSEVQNLALSVSEKHTQLDALINNAGVYVVPTKITDDGLDVRFVVNTIAPYLLTKCLLPMLNKQSRVVNLSSAAQAPLSPDELSAPSELADGAVYAKSKLALTMWSRHLADTLGDAGPGIIAVNPASFLGSKMVKEAYGVSGGNVQKGADILVRAALSDDFAKASGLYFDNDVGDFAAPHADAENTEKNAAVVAKIEAILDCLKLS